MGINVKETLQDIFWQQMLWYYWILTDCFWWKYCHFPHWISGQDGFWILQQPWHHSPNTFICRTGHDFQYHSPTTFTLYVRYYVKSFGPILEDKNGRSAPLQSCNMSLGRKHVTECQDLQILGLSQLLINHMILDKVYL